MKSAAEYENWYEIARGRWVGETEFRLLARLLAPHSHERLLDVGCGTGWFTRRFSRVPGLSVTGLDPNADWLAYARDHDQVSSYVEGDARALPFADASFDRVVSVTALCFIPDWFLGLKEMARVTKTRLSVGVLNRRSLLWRTKGRPGQPRAYLNGHWHTPSELRAGLETLSVSNVRFHSGFFWPSGSNFAQAIENLLPNGLPCAGFLVVIAEKTSSCSA